jgi:hypothetical protein
MPAISQLRRPIIIQHSVDFGDEVVIAFRYDRTKITDAWLRRWTELETAENIGAINSVLAELIEGWDVTDDEGAPFPPTAENIGFLFNLNDKGMLVRELMQASIPSRAEGNASSAPTSILPSASMEPPTMHQNGLVTSPSPAPLVSPSPT